MYRKSAFFNILIVSITSVLVVLSFFFQNILTEIDIWILLASVFLIGIPHGAIDHIVASEIYDGDHSLQHHLKFYSSYLIVMAVLGIIWFYTPVFGMFIFIGISVYHFGQADMEDFLVHRKHSPFWFFVRGAAIMLLIIFSDVQQTIPIIADAIRMESTTLFNYLPNPAAVFIPLTVIYITLSVYSYIKKDLIPDTSFFTDLICLILIFYLSGPLIGFAIYFAVWHSAGHINEMLEFFKKRNRSISVSGFISKSLPFSMVSVFGLFLLYEIQKIYFSGQQFITIMFILISVLTLPHMYIVNKMYSIKE